MGSPRVINHLLTVLPISVCSQAEQLLNLIKHDYFAKLMESTQNGSTAKPDSAVTSDCVVQGATKDAAPVKGMI